MFSISKRPTIGEIHELYENSKAKPSQVFAFFLNRSKTVDKKLNSVQTFTEEFGLERSKWCDQLLQEYLETKTFDQLVEDYPLFGVPYSLKAIIQAEGLEFSASSKILDGFVAPYSSTVFKKVHDAGAVLLSVLHFAGVLRRMDTTLFLLLGTSLVVLGVGDAIFKFATGIDGSNAWRFGTGLLGGLGFAMVLAFPWKRTVA